MAAEPLQFVSNDPAETAGIAEKILLACPNRRIFAIYGNLGAGKTTLVKALCESLGSVDVVKSPTFAIINEYEGAAGPIFHFDFYRIETIEEVFDLGYEEYFDSGHYCFIEWPEMIGNLVPEEAVEIRIQETGPTSRIIDLTLQ